MTLSRSEDVRAIERSLLGGCLRWNPGIGEALLLVRAESFSSDAHQRLFRVLTDLFEAGKPADLVTSWEELGRRGQQQDFGGPGYLADLWDTTATGAFVAYHARLVRDAHIARQLRAAANEILADAENRTGSAEELLESAEQRIFAIADGGVQGDTIALAQAVDETCLRVDARSGGGEEAGFLPTGYPDLDAILCGLHNSELVILAARPSTGKTALGLCIARNLAVDQGVPVFFASLEQSRTELAERLLCCQARVDGQKLRKGMVSRDERTRLANAAETLRRAPVFLDDSAAQTCTRIAANARRLKLRHGIRLVVVDYLQLAEPEDRKASREEQVGACSRRLKALAKELGLPVLALAQLNRQVEHRSGEKPRLADLRDSGQIEQNADTVLLLHRPDFTASRVDVIVAKQRNGPVDEAPLTFLRQFVRFDSFAPVPAYEVAYPHGDYN